MVGIVEDPKDLQDSLRSQSASRHPSSPTLLFDAGGAQSDRLPIPPGPATVQEISASSASSRSNNATRRWRSCCWPPSAHLHRTALGRRIHRDGPATAAGPRHDRRDRRHRPAGTAGHAGQRGSGRRGRARPRAPRSGLAAWLALTPAFDRLVGHRYDPFALPWWAVIAGAILAILTALAASWWPARTAARLPIVEALSGRPAPPQPAHRFALLGTVARCGRFRLPARSRAPSHGADRGRHPGHRRACCCSPPWESGCWQPPPAARRWRCASRCVTWPATRPGPVRRWRGQPRDRDRRHDHRHRRRPAGARPHADRRQPAHQPVIVWLDNPNDPAAPGLAPISADGERRNPHRARIRQWWPAPASTADAIAQEAGGSTVVELDDAVDLQHAGAGRARRRTRRRRAWSIRSRAGSRARLEPGGHPVSWRHRRPQPLRRPAGDIAPGTPTSSPRGTT